MLRALYLKGTFVETPRFYDKHFISFFFLLFSLIAQ